jgi:nucleoside-diphosphate-sugar epimerase
VARVMVTGHRGYIGVQLVDVLQRSGHSVTGVDTGLFDGCEWESFAEPEEQLRKDVRALELDDVRGHDVVMHLAAISNDPMGDVDQELTYAVNRDASIRLAELAKDAGVPRYLFAGSCSVYGQATDHDVVEDDPLNPLTAYAKSKIEVERAVRALGDETFTPVFLRNATAYGHSPMLRIDLVVNNLLACAVALGEIRIMSDGSPWRPLIHCRDIARAFLALADADVEPGVAVNVGANEENYQVRDVAALVQALVPEAEIEFTGEAGNDPRSYRVNFDLLSRLVPGFRLEYTLRRGMEELHAKLREHDFSAADWEGDRFVRLRRLLTHDL